MIPIEVDEITPAWLSEVLGIDVWAVYVLDAHSGTTDAPASRSRRATRACSRRRCS